MDALIHELNKLHSWELTTRITAEELHAMLSEKVNKMIQLDFSALVQLLYRIDVEEPRLRYLLQQHKGEDAGKIIAGLIIQRIEQKLITRAQYRQKDRDIPEEDRW